MDDQMNKRKEKSCINKFITAWIWFILALTLILFLIVTFDRCSFHNRVYEVASVDVVKEKLREIPIDSLRVYKVNTSQNSNHNRRCSAIDTAFESTNTKDSTFVTVYISKSNKDSYSNDVSLLELMKKSDVFLGSNSLTYLVTLIVALLASLLLYRVEGDEIKKESIRETKREADALKKDVDNLNAEAEQLKDELKTSIQNNCSTYEHFTRFNRLLTLNKSIYNLSIIIGNVVMSLSLSKNDDENDAIALEVGNLCSRLSLFCDQINDLLNDCEQRLDYLTRDEHYILSSYLDDMLSGLKKSMKCIKDLNNDTLLSIVNKNFLNIKDVKNVIDSLSRKERNDII